MTNACSIVEPSGPVTRQGQDLYLKLSERSDPACQGLSTNVSRTLPLGALEPGNYLFHFMSDGVEVYATAFAVPAGTGRPLDFARTPVGELELQINGLDSVEYTIQASANLEDWSDLQTHAGTALGPYTIFEPLTAAPARFYRVRSIKPELRCER